MPLTAAGSGGQTFGRLLAVSRSTLGLIQTTYPIWAGTLTACPTCRAIYDTLPVTPSPGTSPRNWHAQEFECPGCGAPAPSPVERHCKGLFHTLADLKRLCSALGRSGVRVPLPRPRIKWPVQVFHLPTTIQRALQEEREPGTCIVCWDTHPLRSMSGSRTCQHAFCHSCFETVRLQIPSHMPCPTCRQPFDWWDAPAPVRGTDLRLSILPLVHIMLRTDTARQAAYPNLDKGRGDIPGHLLTSRLSVFAEIRRHQTPPPLLGPLPTPPWTATAAPARPPPPDAYLQDTPHLERLPRLPRTVSLGAWEQAIYPLMDAQGGLPPWTWTPLFMAILPEIHPRDWLEVIHLAESQSGEDTARAHKALDWIKIRAHQVMELDWTLLEVAERHAAMWLSFSPFLHLRERMRLPCLGRYYAALLQRHSHLWESLERTWSWGGEERKLPNRDRQRWAAYFQQSKSLQGPVSPPPRL